MRTGFRFPLEGLFRPVLFNFSPNIGDRRPSYSEGTAKPKCVALSAGWGGLRKNVYTNVMGAALSDRIEAIWLYAPDIELAPPLSKKLRPQRYVSRETTFQLMAASSLCLNVSLVDCHPMVNVESQTFGRPCLRGPLFLDALEEHPYVKATTVYDVNSPAEIRDRIDLLCSIPAVEREQLTLDYQKRSDEVARTRYRDFLEL